MHLLRSNLVNKGLMFRNFNIYLLMMRTKHLFVLIHIRNKGEVLALLILILSCVSVTNPCGVLGQVCHLIVSIPDLCLLPYFGVPIFRLLLTIILQPVHEILYLLQAVKYQICPD